MGQRAIEGNDVLLEGLRDGEYIPFACATSIDFFYSNELIEKATVGTQGWKRWKLGIGEWDLSLGSVTNVLPSDNMLTIFDTFMGDLKKNGLDIRLTFEDKDGNLKSITGHVVIPRSRVTAPIDQFSEDTIEMKGDGPFAINTILIDPVSSPGDVHDINFTSPAGGELSLTYIELQGKDLKYVGRDGVGREVITLGIPNSKQVKFNAGTGNVSWTDALNPLEWVLIIYQ